MSQGFFNAWWGPCRPPPVTLLSLLIYRSAMIASAELIYCPWSECYSTVKWSQEEEMHDSLYQQRKIVSVNLGNSPAECIHMTEGLSSLSVEYGLHQCSPPLAQNIASQDHNVDCGAYCLQISSCN